MAQRNRLTHLVPALLTVIGALPALDGIAPVITVPDLITTGQSIRVGVTNPVAALNLESWSQDIYVRDVNSLSWVSLDVSPGGSLPTPSTAGVAVVGQVGDGIWQYQSGNPRTWTTIVGVTETAALLLPLQDGSGNGVALRFIPNIEANPSGPARLTLRAWDGSSGLAFQIASTVNSVPGAAAPNGGSPSAFSAETRIVQTTILANGTNSPPNIFISPSSVSLGSGESTSFYVSSTDSDGDLAVWSAAFQSYSASASVSISDNLDGSAYINVTADDPITVSASETLEVIASDGSDSSFATAVVDLSNLPPVLVSPPSQVTVAANGSLTVSLTGNDPDGDSSLLTWSIGSTGYLFNVSGSSTIPAGTFSFTVNANQGTGSGSIPVTVTDENGITADFYIPISIVTANQPPVIDPQSRFSSIAVVGQPWETFLAVTDPDGDTNLTLAATGEESSSLPPGFLLTKLSGQPTWRLHGTPSTTDPITFEVTPDDGISSPSTYSYSLTVGDPAEVTTSLSPLPLSTPGNPVYVAIAPGSVAGYSSLLAALQPYGPDIARGWWYSGGFRDIEEQRPRYDSLGLDLQPRTGVFLASTVSLGSVEFRTKPFPMPFRITLEPNAWTFFGVPPLWDGSTTFTVHDWSDFRLDRANGTTVDDPVEIVDVLGERQPFGYDPTTTTNNGYAEVGSMSTGSGYWVYNSSASTYQLARVGASDPSQRVTVDPIIDGEVDGLRVSALSTRTSDITPPAPPRGGATSAKAEPGSGSCGAGGLGGLLIAGLALIGLRRRT